MGEDVFRIPRDDPLHDARRVRRPTDEEIRRPEGLQVVMRKLDPFFNRFYFVSLFRNPDQVGKLHEALIKAGL